MTNKILLSSITTLALLLGGCSEDGTATNTNQSKTDTSANIAANNTPTETVANSENAEDTPSGNTPAEHAANYGPQSDFGIRTPIPTEEAEIVGGSSEGGTDNDNAVDGHIPGPGGGADIPKETDKTGGWFGRTQVSATLNGKTYSHNTAGVFGELMDSKDAKDQHDIPGYATAVLQIVFPQTDWSDDNGDYFSNYKKMNKAEKSWTFQIKNQHTVNLANAAIEISLDGIYTVNYEKIKGKLFYSENDKTDTEKRNALTDTEKRN
ncbi:MAG TPA: hypothetical protein EYP23_01080, partial [Thermoplasmata archaeon]|nr:hypothetical protein [Thermoplasmata archaeon]